MRAAVSTCGGTPTGLLLLNNTRHALTFTSTSTRDKRQVEMAAEEAEDSLTLVVTGGQQQQPEHRSVSLTHHQLFMSTIVYHPCITCLLVQVRTHEDQHGEAAGDGAPRGAAAQGDAQEAQQAQHEGEGHRDRGLRGELSLVRSWSRDPAMLTADWLCQDHDMYAANARGGAEDEAAVTARIRELVFTYLNAVQLLYQSDLLANKLRLVLVRSHWSTAGHVPVLLSDWSRCGWRS